MVPIAEASSKRDLLSRPFYLLVLLYFLSLSTEMLNIKLLIFKVKFNVLMGVVTFLIFFLVVRVLRLDREFFYVAFACIGSMLLSMLKGYHPIACTGFICYYLFNYFIFFVLPVNLIRVFGAEKILELYFLSFVLIGIYAAAQVFVSFSGCYLPFTTQQLMSIGRGQGFSYEPSYYALYMAPYAVFQTTRFFLQKKKEQEVGKIVIANFFFLVSTSTGCVFSYLAMTVSIAFLKFFRVIRDTSFSKILWATVVALGSVFLVLWNFAPFLVSKLFLKFFWAGGIHHGSLRCRWEGIERDWSVFLDHPILGTGFGGTTTYLFQKKGIDIGILDPEILSAQVATNVTMEIFASLGMIGVLIFASFFYLLWKQCWSTLRLWLTDPERTNVIALIVSLGVMFFALQFNSSIMRAYTWVHVGICVGYMQYLRQLRLKMSAQDAREFHHIDGLIVAKDLG